METGSTPPGRTPGGDPGQQGGPPPGGPQAPQTPPGQPPGAVQQPGQMQPVPTGPGGVPLADYGQRVGAALLDGLIVGVGFVVLYFILTAIVTAIAAGSEGGAIVTALVGLAALGVAYLLYAPMLMKRAGENNGQTVGKQVLDIRVVSEDGQPMDFGKGALRDVLVRIIASWLTCGLFGILDILWPLWDDERRALHDMAAKTRVVRA